MVLAEAYLGACCVELSVYKARELGSYTIWFAGALKMPHDAIGERMSIFVKR
jgi:hypothetical protein